MPSMLRAGKGFTLIELMVVIIIIGILAAIAIPLYNGYVKSAIASEGQALVAAVAAAERVYYGQYNSYITNIAGGGTPPDTLGIDATQNKYFTNYDTGVYLVTGFLVKTSYTDTNGKIYLIELDQPSSGKPTGTVEYNGTVISNF